MELNRIKNIENAMNIQQQQYLNRFDKHGNITGGGTAGLSHYSGMTSLQYK